MVVVPTFCATTPYNVYQVNIIGRLVHGLQQQGDFFELLGVRATVVDRQRGERCAPLLQRLAQARHGIAHGGGQRGAEQPAGGPSAP